MSNKYTADQLFDEIITTSTITCGKCEKEEEITDDGYEAATHFFEEGWRVTKKFCYCPECAKKYLKQ